MHSYQTRLSLLFLITLLVLFGATSWFHARHDRALLREDLRTRTRAIVNTLRQATKVDRPERPIPVEVLQPLCEGMAQLENVQWVEVFDSDANVVAHSITERIGKPPLPQHQEYVVKVLNGAPDLEAWDDEGERYSLFAAIRPESRSLVVELVLDTAWIESEVMAGWLRLGLLFLGLIGGGFLVLLVGMRRFVGAESARREAEASASHLGEILENSLNEIYIFDADTLSFKFVNLGARSNIGYTAEELRKLSPLDLKPDFTPKAFDELIAPLRSGRTERLHFETRHRRKDGSLYPVEVFLGRSKRASKLVFVAFILDISERKRADQELRQSYKLQAVGELAAGIAHDFNNLLTVIGGSIDIAQQMLSDPTVSPELVQGRFDDAREATESAASITRQLLTFSQTDSVDPISLDIGSVLESLLPMLRRTIREDIVIKLRCDAETPTVRMDAGQLEQLALNLTINARDAMPEGGVVDIHVFSDPPGTPSETVCLTVTDTGTGIAPQDLDRIFDPFFTTKPLGKGTGLGLATVHGIVTQSGGSVRVESTVGKGARFEIRLPASQQQAVERIDVKESAPQGGTETIIVCEDNESVLDVMRAALEEAGYDVVATDVAAAALHTASDESRDVRLLITDVLMPEMNGRELADRFLETRPKSQVLFVSGYAPTDLETGGRPWVSENFLRKPFRPLELLRRVRALLDDGHASR